MKKKFSIISAAYFIGLLLFLTFPEHFLRDLLINFLPYIVFLHIPLFLILFVLFHHIGHSFQWKGRLIMTGIIISILFQGINIFIPSFSFETIEATSQSSFPLKVLFSNVMKSNKDPSRLIDLIQKEKPDIIGIVELTPLFTKTFVDIQNQYPFQTLVPATHGFGIGLFSKIELLEPRIEEFSNNIPFIKTRITWDDQFVDLFVVHLLPPITRTGFKQRNKSLEELSTFIKVKNPTLVIGDFNLTPWSVFYQRFTKQTGLTNARNLRNGFQMSWYGFGFYLPIDHIFHSSNIQLSRFEIGSDIGSDHYPLISEFIF